MHVHVSVKSKKSGKDFSNDDGSESDVFYHSVAGMQRYLSGAMALMAPYVIPTAANRYRRFTSQSCVGHG